MTRKDYQLIAAALYQSKPPMLTELTAFCSQWQETRNAICAALAKENARFDAVKFLSACNEG